MQLHRAILFVKLVLIAALIWGIFDLISGGDNEQEPPMASKVEVPKTEITLLERQPLSTDYKAILELDLFGLSQPNAMDTNEGPVLSTRFLSWRQINIPRFSNSPKEKKEK